MGISAIYNAATLRAYNYPDLVQTATNFFQPIRVQIETDVDCCNKYDIFMHRMTELSVEDNYFDRFYRGQFNKSLVELIDTIQSRLCYDYLEGQWVSLPYFVVLAQADDTMLHEALRTTDSEKAIKYATYNIGKVKNQPFQVLFYMYNGAMPTVVCRSKSE